MEIKVNIDEKKLEEMITQFIARETVNRSSFRYDLKDEIGKAIKEYVYSEKQQIIERVIDRASREIVRKGLPKLLEELK